MNQVSKDKYRRFCKAEAKIPIFYTPEWLDTVCGDRGWSVYFYEKDHQIRAVFPFMLQSKFGKPVFKMPKFTPYLGVLFFPPEDIYKREALQSFKKQACREILSQIRDLFYFNIAFHPDFDDWHEFYWQKYYQRCRYTYRIDTSAGASDIWAAFNSKIRNHIRTAEDTLKVSTAENTDTLFLLNQSTFSKQNMTVPYRKEMLIAIYDKFHKLDQCQVLIAENKLTGEAEAGILLLTDHAYMYCLVSGMKSESSRGAMSLLIWTAIQHAAQKGLNFDFEGSDLQAVEKFYRGFGGVLTPYYQIYKSMNKLTDAVLFFSSKFQ